MKKIKLTQGKFAIVDDADYAELARFNWYFNGRYAMRDEQRNKIRKDIRMHRVIAKTPNGMETDHINGDKLDNRRENLRVCTGTQNKMNAQIRKDNTSGFKGVMCLKIGGKRYIIAYIKKNKKQIRLGCFTTKTDAALAYNEAAKKLFGEFARLNKI